jgi:hypothetical protein
MRLLLHLFELELPIGGHGYDFSNGFPAESEGDDDEGGIPTLWIVAALLLPVVTIGVLASLNPSRAIARLRSFGPKALIILIIAAPLAAWTVGSQSEKAEDLILERWTGLDGDPELLVSLGDKALNKLETTSGKRNVRVECVDRKGKLVLDAEQKWPFIYEAGYDYAHAHQPASLDQLQRIDRCRLVGARVRLEAGVTGALAR